MPSKFVTRLFLSALTAIIGISASSPAAHAQTQATPSRITQAIDERSVTTLRGNTHPLAQARFDQGAAPDSLALNRMQLVLKRSADQEATLDQLLDQQQDSSSPNFHQWLTPQQFGQQFGPSDQDIQAITSWLQSRGFRVNAISNGRTVIEFSGTAGQVRQAFHTTIHRYTVNNESHWANSSDPKIPAALAPVVAGVNTLYNFPRRAMHHITGVYQRDKATGLLTPDPRAITFPNPCNPTAQPFCNFGVAPADFAKIYTVPNLLLSPVPTTQYNGDGQTIVVVGESEVNPQDVATFRQLFGLPAPKLNIIVNGPDPGFDPGGAETEADLDVQWSGAVAPNATIDLVLAQPTEVSLGVDLAAQYAVDNNLAPVLSESFGICEFFMGTADNQFYNQLWQQASAEGITVAVSSGDAGSATCDQNAGTQGAAVFGLTVSGFTSTPYNVSVGGTDFNDISNFTQYWSTTTGDQPKVSSALSYIPEVTWNDSCTNSEIFSFLGVTSAIQACNNQTAIRDGFVNITGGSGGVSNCTISDGVHESSCSGGYAKPSWQSATGVPADGKRDIPDVSLFASNGFNSSFYLICEADVVPGSSSCDPYAANSDSLGIGGTSASSPAFAAMMSLVNQATGSRQGNANYILYKLYGQSGARCTSQVTPAPASTCVFYDIPAGSTIVMPCVPGTPDVPASSTCTAPAGDSSGVLTGYSTGTGYDQATGLGSVNATNLISSWKTFATNLKASTTTLTLNSGTAVNITHGATVPVSITVTGTGGTPSGTVSLIAQTGANTQQAVGSGVLSNGTATFSTNALPGGSNYSVFAQYSGDGNFTPSTSAPQSATVAPEQSKVSLAYELFDPNTGILTNPNATTAPFGAFALLRMNVMSQAGDTCSQNAPGNLGCPTGSVTVADNGNSLDGGIFTLNSNGYSEDQVVSLLTGPHTLAASYLGDNSFSSSAVSSNLTIQKAPTTLAVVVSAPSFGGDIGSSFVATISTNAFVPNSSGFPTGSVQFFIDGTAYQTPAPITGSLNTTTGAAQAVTSVTVNNNNNPPPFTVGQHTVTAQYLGDSNYVAAQSSSTPFTVLGLTTTNLTSSLATIQQGGTVTFTATVVSAQSGGPAVTGAVQFSENGINFGSPVTLTNGQAQITTTSLPLGTLNIHANYPGDSNYFGSGAFFTETVNAGPTFTVSANPTTVTISAPGQSASTTLTFTSQNGLTGSGGLTSSTCGTSSTEEITCTLSAFTLPANSTTTATLTFNTTAASAAPPVRQFPPFPDASPNARNRFILFTLFLFFATLAASRISPRRRTAFVCAALLLSVLAIGVACGGGSGTTTPTNPGTPLGNTPVSVSISIGGTAQTVPNLTVTVQ